MNRMHTLGMIALCLALLTACSTTRSNTNASAVPSMRCMCECDPARGSYNVRFSVEDRAALCRCPCDTRRGHYSYWTMAEATNDGAPSPIAGQRYRSSAPPAPTAGGRLRSASSPPPTAVSGITASSGLPPVISSRYPSGTPGGSSSMASTGVTVSKPGGYRAAPLAANDDSYESIRRDAIRSAKRRAALRKKWRAQANEKKHKHVSSEKQRKKKTQHSAKKKDKKTTSKHNKNGSKPYKVLGKWYYPLDTAKGYNEVGMASWYGKRFHGGPTASGETFDMNALTAAHRTLPFGSKVKVTNLETGSNVIVRINDRGPFNEDRLIDVSAAAADRLGFNGKGEIKVRVEAVE